MVVQGCANCRELRRQLADCEEEIDAFRVVHAAQEVTIAAQAVEIVELKAQVSALVVQRREDIEAFKVQRDEFKATVDEYGVLYSELGEDLVALKVQRDQDRAKVQALEARLDQKDSEALFEQKTKEATASLQPVNKRDKKRFRSL